MAVIWCSILLTVLRRKFECKENRLGLIEGIVLLSYSEKSKAVEIHVQKLETQFQICSFCKNP